MCQKLRGNDRLYNYMEVWNEKDIDVCQMEKWRRKKNADIARPEMGCKERAACALHIRIPPNVAWGCLSIIGLGMRSVQRGRRAGCVSCVVKNTIRAAF